MGETGLYEQSSKTFDLFDQARDILLRMRDELLIGWSSSCDFEVVPISPDEVGPP